MDRGRLQRAAAACLQRVVSFAVLSLLLSPYAVPVAAAAMKSGMSCCRTKKSCCCRRSGENGATYIREASCARACVSSFLGQQTKGFVPDELITRRIDAVQTAVAVSEAGPSAVGHSLSLRSRAPPLS